MVTLFVNFNKQIKMLYYDGSGSFIQVQCCALEAPMSMLMKPSLAFVLMRTPWACSWRLHEHIAGLEYTSYYNMFICSLKMRNRVIMGFYHHWFNLYLCCDRLSPPTWRKISKVQKSMNAPLLLQTLRGCVTKNF